MYFTGKFSGIFWQNSNQPPKNKFTKWRSLTYLNYEGGGECVTFYICDIDIDIDVVRDYWKINQVF